MMIVKNVVENLIKDLEKYAKGRYELSENEGVYTLSTYGIIGRDCTDVFVIRCDNETPIKEVDYDEYFYYDEVNETGNQWTSESEAYSVTHL